MSIRTPGVYLNEDEAYPNSVVAVETSIPAFIGYTEKAEFKGKSLKKAPTRIDSLIEYETLYGKGSTTKYALNVVNSSEEEDFEIHGISYTLDAVKETHFLLYDSLKFYFQNGGGSCFIISVGTYKDTKGNKPFTSITPFKNAIDLLKNENEPTMLVVPDAVYFNQNDCYRLQEHILMHCGDEMNRIAILDIYDGYRGMDDLDFNPIESFRNNVSSDAFSYGVAYYPWLNTTIVKPSDVNYKSLNFEGLKNLISICKTAIVDFEGNLQNDLLECLNSLDTSENNSTSADCENTKPKISKVDRIHSSLMTAIPAYKQVMDNILIKKNLLPPSGAMAGIYTLVDNQHGVWKAPANIALNSVVAPAVNIDHGQQEDLNSSISGKAICAIRQFQGLGTLVWGVRTLDTNSLDWRYINVRRTMIMIEQSIKLASRAYIFEPNVKKTWLTLEAMLSNFLTNLWKQGALVGAVPQDAFDVSVGVGSTMTMTDIENGIMRIMVKVAISHPAEFLIITIEQQQKA